MFLTKKLNQDLEKRVKIYARRNNIKLDNENKKQVIEQYFYDKPKMKLQYDTKMKQLRKIEIAAVSGVLAVGTLAGIFKATSIGVDVPQEPRQETTTQSKENDEHEAKETNKEEIDVSKIVEEANKQREKEYKNQLVGKLKQNRDADNVDNLRKEVIVGEYNKQHANTQDKITVNDLKVIESTPQYLVATVDKLGNVVSYNKHLVQKGEQLAENEIIYDSYHQVYVYMIKDEIVAMYTPGGTPIQLDGQYLEDTFFANTVNLINKSITVREAYNSQKSEQDIKKVEESWAEAVMEFEGRKQIVKNENEIGKE